MNPRLRNPFNVTKAVDFSDTEIRDYWVDIPGGTGFLELAKPASPMPMLILGGKGSGKTHVMRYFSYGIQKLRHGAAILDGMRDDGYIGTYLRCRGLNARRFRGKGQDADVWSTVFSYYMDLTLCELALRTVQDALSSWAGLQSHELPLCRALMALFDVQDSRCPENLCEFIAYLRGLQREMDIAVNNCSMSRSLEVSIRATPGRLVFGTPQVLEGALPPLSGLVFLYLIDEFENLSADQQRYVNTLVREKESPCSFKIGARLYGIRTYGTLSAGEENKEGSEFEKLPLDLKLRTNRHYRHFAISLVGRRLVEAGYIPGPANDAQTLASCLRSCFVTFPRSPLAQAETAFVLKKYEQRERPYVERLRRKLVAGARAGAAPGVHSPEDVKAVIAQLAAHEYPLLEKASILLLYKDWYSKRDLLDSAGRIASDRVAYHRSPAKSSRHHRILKHFSQDLLAQLRRDCGKKQGYLGIDAFVEMSQGLPRNLLVILKRVFEWAAFNGDEPFTGAPISIQSQQRGLKEAAEWFFEDARMPGTDGRIVRDSVSRLATLFREIRFADKPSECSVSAFSVDASQLTDDALRVIELAANWSLLISIPGGQRDRNTKRVDAKFQLNPMLSPRWDLPIHRRGAIALSGDEANAIFDAECASAFDELLKARVGRMTAPFLGKGSASAALATGDAVLPGFEDG